MSEFTTRNKAFFIKPEAVSGVEETLALADFVKCEGLTRTPNFEQIDRDEHTGTLDTSEGLVGVGGFGFSGTVHLRGAGVAGTAPDFSPFFLAAGFDEFLTAADVTGTAQGGSASTIQLAAAAVTSDNQFEGHVVEITGGTGAGQVRVVDSSIAASDTLNTFPDWTVTPDATSVYSVHAAAVYRQSSTGLVTATGGLYENSSKAGQNPRLSKSIALVANLNFTIGGRESPRVEWTTTGILPSLPANVASLGTPTPPSVTGPAYRDVEAFLGQNVAKFSQITLDVANEIAQADDPTQLYGLDGACIVSRGATGKINPRGGNTAVQDIMADWLGETRRAFWTTWGTVAGNRMSLYIPQLKYTGAEDEDVNGFLHDGAPFEAKLPDRSMYWCFH